MLNLLTNVSFLNYLLIIKSCSFCHFLQHHLKSVFQTQLGFLIFP
nr:MAG TPA: hypothetical protein [Caudoviricetes sp.]